MRGLIQFNDIKELTLNQVCDILTSFEKPLYGDLKLSDMIVGNMSEINIFSWDHSNAFGYGVYIFYDGEMPLYVGKAVKHFLHRFLSNVHYDPRPEYGFNWMLKGINVRYLKGTYVEYTKDHHIAALQKLNGFEVIRINGLNNGITVKQCDLLERIVNAGLHTKYSSLINGSKTFTENQMNTPIFKLMKL
jgi:hypothetical protein